MSRRGNVRVKIDADADGVKRGTREAERHLDRLGGASKRVGSSMAGAGRVAGGVAAVGIGAVALEARHAYDAFDESRKVANQTNAVLKSTGGTANVTAREVAALADVISKKTGVDDEAIQKGENLLLTFKNIRNEAGAGNAVFDRATRSALNLSKAGFGSLESTSKQLGKALNDPVKGITALSRAGVTFTQQQKDQITTLVESNRTLDAQKLILQEVESQVGGSARAQGTNAEKMRVAFGNVEEQLGRGLAPAVDAVSGKLRNMAVDALPAVERTATAVERIFARKDLDLGDKLTMSRGAVAENMRPVRQMIEREIGRARLGPKLADAVEDGLPRVMEAAGRGGTKATVAFLRGWWNADGWGKLVTVGFLMAKLGAFRAAGTAAGTWFGTRAAGGAAAGMTSALPARLGAATKAGQFRGRLAGIGRGIGGPIGVAAGVTLTAAILSEVDKNGLKDTLKSLLDPFNIGKGGHGLPGLKSTRAVPFPEALGIVRVPPGGRPPGAPRWDPNITGRLTRTPRVPGTAPTGGRGAIIGTPGAGTHTLGNWQSDNAVDIRITRGSPVVALEDGTVTKVSVKSDGGGRFAGSSVTIRGHSNSYFYAHLSAVSVRQGQRVRAGQAIGSSGVANGVPHLHFATEKGDPRSMRLPGGGTAATRVNPQQRIVEQAARRHGIDPAILWGLYGAETEFGRNNRTSHDGARGPFQIMPDTAKELGVDPMNFREAAFGAARYLAQYKGRGTRGMLAAYNAGPNGNPQNKETQDYIRKVLGYRGRWPTEDQESLSPTDWKQINEAIANRLMKPILALVGGSRQASVSGQFVGAMGSRLALQQRRNALTTEDLSTPGGRQARISELSGIRTIQLKTGIAQNWQLAAIKRQIAQRVAAVKKLQGLLKRAPRGQRGTIRGQIGKLKADLKDLRDEARELGFDVQGTLLDIQETDQDIALAGQGLESGADAPSPMDFLDRDIQLAQLSGDQGALRTALLAKQAELQRQFGIALGTPDPRDETEIAGLLIGIKESIEGLDSTVQQSLQEQLDLQKATTQDLQRRLNVSEAQFGAFQGWLFETYNGTVGGRLGLGFQTASHAGSAGLAGGL